jgi:hypothetical protein
MTPEVQEAIDEIAQAYAACALEIVEDGQGGALVTLNDVSLGGPYQQSSSWIGFHITHTYPYSDVYPHFVRHDLSRSDGKPLGAATSIGSFRGGPAIQLSRSAKRHNAETDTALLKLQKVLQWLNTRP